MIRPEVRVIQQQDVQTTSIDASQDEINDLLAKYGHKQQYVSNPVVDPNANLTFDQMLQMQEQKEREERIRRERLRNGATPVSFDPYNMGYSETKYTNVEITDSESFGIKIQIVSDMKIPR